jgi:hypothetical protein
MRNIVDQKNQRSNNDGEFKKSSPLFKEYTSVADQMAETIK